MELHEYIRVLRRSWLLIVVMLVVGLAGAVAYSLLQVPSYEASAKVLVSTQSTGSPSELVEGDRFATQRVKTYSALVTTRTVLAPVANALGLPESDDELAKQIEASVPLDTSIIEITVNRPSAEQAATFANALSQSLIDAVARLETPETPGAANSVKLTQVQEAAAPISTISPNLPLNITLGGLVGIAIGIIVALLRESLGSRVRNESDLWQIAEVPVIGGLAFDPEANDRPLVVHAEPHSAFAEAFRTLRTNVQHLSTVSPMRGIVITSSVDGEGKSTTAANLAIATANNGSRVLLVDANLRRPRIAEIMGLDGTHGLTDVIVDRVSLNDAIQSWGTAGLSVLAAGQMVTNPSELMGSARMTALVYEVAREFDIVIFDSPPVVPFTDASVLAKSVGVTILTVAAGKTHKSDLRRAVSTMDDAGERISGCVMTMMPSKGPDAYGHSGRSHSAQSPANPRRRDAQDPIRIVQ